MCDRMVDRLKVISDLEEQIAWIRDNDFHKFPGWGHAVLAMRDAIALLKAQETETSDALKPDDNVGCWYDMNTPDNWYCADGVRRDGDI